MTEEAITENDPIEETVEVAEDPGTPTPDGEGGEGEELPEVAEAPAYEPNLKFSVRGEEREFDDWAKALVKDEDTEKQFREIHEKVYGLEHVKSHRDQLLEEQKTFKEAEERNQVFRQNVETLDRYIEKGNYDAFFQGLKIPEQQIIQWAANRLQYQQMSPAEKAQYDANVQQGTEAVHAQLENVSLKNEREALVHERRMFELDQHLGQPQYSEAVQTYNSRMGNPEAFRNAVRERGMFHQQVNGVDIPVEQAVNEVLQMTGFQASAQANPPLQQVPEAQAPVPGATTAPQKKPTIPAVDGSGHSAVGTKVSSIADLKRLAEQRA